MDLWSIAVVVLPLLRKETSVVLAERRTACMFDRYSDAMNPKAIPFRSPMP
jgi:hypothetical protein